MQHLDHEPQPASGARAGEAWGRASDTYLDRLGLPTQLRAARHWLSSPGVWFCASLLAPTDQRILRTWAAIDGRNPLWESPHYTVTLACHYRMLAADDEWMLLAKRPNRCAAPAPLGGPRDIVAGQMVDVPIARDNSIITASFRPSPSGVLRMAAGAVVKDFQPLTVDVGGTTFRLPDGLAQGPLIVALPVGLWPSRFSGDTSYDRLVFNEPGVVQFHTIEVAD